MLGMKTGSPILSPNRFVGSATKALFIKPNSLTPKPKTRLLLTNGAFNGSSDRSAGALENGNHDSPNASYVTNGSQPKPMDSPSPQQTPRAAGTPSTPAHDFYRQVVDSTRSPPSFSPLQAKNQFVPKLTKPGYTVYPSIAELEAMSEADLAAVTGFTVERSQYGSVAWDGAVDVRGVDIDSVVVIESKNVSVYDEAEERGEKPQQGSKLNRPAVITMYDVYPKDGAESSAEAKYKLKRKIEKSTKKMGAELLSFQSESGVWTFRVGHFSRYGLDDSDDDLDNDIESTPPLETSDDEEESVIPANQIKELGGASRMHAPIDEDESMSAHTDKMSNTEISDQSESEEDGYQELNEIDCAAEEAYAMMTEEVLAECEEEVSMFEPLVAEEVKVLFPDEAADDLIRPVTQPLKPIGPIPSTGFCSMLAEKCGLNKASSSNIDFGLRMRRSFRVGKII
jgi:nuclear pore complex protein Nup98-Nup96